MSPVMQSHKKDYKKHTYEDNGGRVFAGGAEQGADAGCRHALEHLHKLGSVGCSTAGTAGGSTVETRKQCNG